MNELAVTFLYIYIYIYFTLLIIIMWDRGSILDSGSRKKTTGLIPDEVTGLSTDLILPAALQPWYRLSP
jgi:hypothetical protein